MFCELTSIWISPYLHILLVGIFSIGCKIQFKVKGVLYSMMGPDLLGLTVAVWNIVGQCFLAVCRGLNHWRYFKLNYKALCPIPRYRPRVKHEKDSRWLRSIGLSESCHNFFRSCYRRVCLSALKVLLTICIYKHLNMPSLNHVIR